MPLHIPTQQSRSRRRLAPFLALVALGVGSVASSVGAQNPPDPELFDTGVLRDFDIDFDAADWLARIERGETVTADLRVEGETYADVGISEKGNSSARVSGAKQPMNVTLDATVKGQRLMGYDVINLNNGFMNPTFTREVLTLRSLAEHMPMPQGAWARVKVGGEYFGLYVLVEQIEGTFLKRWFRGNGGWLFKADAPDGAGGPVGPGPGPRPLAERATLGAPAALSAGSLALTRPAALGAAGGGLRSGPAPLAPDQGGGGGFRSALQWQGEDLAAYQASYDLKSTATDDAPWQALRELTRVLDASEAEGGPSPEAFPEAIRQVLDVDGVLWYLAGMNLFTNFDSYYSGHNFYLYRAEEDGRWHVLAWDVNEAFGLFPGAGIDPSDSTAVARTDPFLMAEGQSAASRPLIRKLLAVPAFRADYLAHYRTLRETVFEPVGLAQRIAAYQDLIREAAETDPNRLYPFDLFARNVDEDVRANGRAIPGILGVAEARQAWLGARADLQAPDLSLAERQLLPATPVAGEPAALRLRLDGADQPRSLTLVYRVNDGAPQRETMAIGRDGDWLASLPLLDRDDRVSYFVRAELSDGRADFFPASNLLHPWTYRVAGASLPNQLGGPLVINEVLADNGSILADPAGEFDDWVELYNRGDVPIQLAGYHLSDDPEDPLAYALPELSLAPGGHYLVWCDNDPDQGPDHAGFRLAKGGETLILSTETGTVDRIDFGEQTTDVSLARLPDGAELWRDCREPSPLAVNACSGEPSVTVMPGPTPSAEPTEPGGTPTEPTATREPGPGPSETAGPTTSPGGPGRVYLPVLRRS